MLPELRDYEGQSKIRLCGWVIRATTYSQILNEINTRAIRDDAYCQITIISPIFMKI